MKIDSTLKLVIAIAALFVGFYFHDLVAYLISLFG